MKDLDYQGKIEVVFIHKGDTLEVQIKDNGVEQSSSGKRKSYGVSITKKRLNHINQFSKSSLDIQHQSEGTIVTLAIQLS